MLLAGSMVLSLSPIPETDGFDFPTGAPDGEGYYDAQPFGNNDHLGADLNGIGGGDTDKGDAVQAVANGRVVIAEDLGGGWGKVVIVAHRLPDGEHITSLYAHLDELSVELGEDLVRGDSIGTIGDADGVYIPHLHFEIRSDEALGVGGGYSAEQEGWVDPMAFIEGSRPSAPGE
jgi:murein DD-endopeptidase MepM/ murein hydrolase activator NlpD